MIKREKEYYIAGYMAARWQPRLVDGSDGGDFFPKQKVGPMYQ
jgi:hypothetical protein